MDDPDLLVTEADVAELDRRELLRRADVLRRVARLLVIVAGGLAAVWLWAQIRFQMSVVDDLVGGFDPNSNETFDVSWLERFDFFATSAPSLSLPVLLAGFGAWLHFAADHAVVRLGGHLTPWRAGDQIDDEAEPIDLDPG